MFCPKAVILILALFQSS